VFFLSGLAALIYQIVWQRLLVFFSGSDVYSSTLVVAAFMAGLGVGHLAGGHLADRSSRRTNLLFFAIAELATAAFSLLSRPLYYDLLYVRLGPLAIPAPAMAAVLFASLLWPTFFMGVSLPLLARSFPEDVELAASRVGAVRHQHARRGGGGAHHDMAAASSPGPRGEPVDRSGAQRHVRRARVSSAADARVVAVSCCRRPSPRRRRRRSRPS
jgi:MFS family permease